MPSSAKIVNEDLISQAQWASDEYLKISEKIRTLEQRRSYLLKLIKTSFDQQYTPITENLQNPYNHEKN
jgi:hypothetical protein